MLLARTTADDHDRKTLMDGEEPKLPDEVVAMHPGHLEVGEDDVEASFAELHEAVDSVDCKHDLHTEALQMRLGDLAYGQRIVDDEGAHPDQRMRRCGPLACALDLLLAGRSDGCGIHRRTRARRARRDGFRRDGPGRPRHVVGAFHRAAAELSEQPRNIDDEDELSRPSERDAGK